MLHAYPAHAISVPKAAFKPEGPKTTGASESQWVAARKPVASQPAIKCQPAACQWGPVVPDFIISPRMRFQFRKLPSGPKGQKRLWYQRVNELQQGGLGKPASQPASQPANPPASQSPASQPSSQQATMPASQQSHQRPARQHQLLVSLCFSYFALKSNRIA